MFGLTRSESRKLKVATLGVAALLICNSGWTTFVVSPALQSSASVVNSPNARNGMPASSFGASAGVESSTALLAGGLVAGMAAMMLSKSKRTQLKALYGKPREVQIIPSVLPADFGKLGEDCKRLEVAGVDRIQFDVMDGNFVPNLTFGPDVIAYMKKYCGVKFETQLMVEQRCIDYMLPQFVEATNQPGKPGVVICHVEACTHLHRNLGQIRDLGGSPSVALNPHTPAEAVENVLDMVDHVLVMTVNPGFGGQAYIPTMIPKIEKLRKMIVDRGLDVDIEVDGGIKANETIMACAEAGANCFIAGSGLFAYDDLSEGVKELREKALQGQKGKAPA